MEVESARLGEPWSGQRAGIRIDSGTPAFKFSSGDAETIPDSHRDCMTGLGWHAQDFFVLSRGLNNSVGQSPKNQ